MKIKLDYQMLLYYFSSHLSILEVVYVVSFRILYRFFVRDSGL